MLPYEHWPEWASLNRIDQSPALSLRPIQSPMMGLPPPATPPPSTTTPVSPSMPLVSTLPVGPMATLGSLASTVSSPGDRASPSTNSAPRGEIGRVPDLSSTSTARQGPSGLFVGLGGDLGGRPSPFDRIVGPATSGTGAGASASASDGIGLRIGIGLGVNPPGNHRLDGPISGRIDPREDDVILASPVGEARLTDPGLDDQQRAGFKKIDDMWNNKLRDEIVRSAERGPRYASSDVVAAPSHSPRARRRSARPSRRGLRYRGRHAPWEMLNLNLHVP